MNEVAPAAVASTPSKQADCSKSVLATSSVMQSSAARALGGINVRSDDTRIASRTARLRDDATSTPSAGDQSQPAARSSRGESASGGRSSSRGPRTLVSGVQSNSASAQLLSGLVTNQSKAKKSRSRSSRPERPERPENAGSTK